MARIRTIKPEFWTDSLMVQLPHLTRLLYIALWNVADDHGFIRDEPERIAMEVMPREMPIDVDSSLQLLFAAGRLEWYVNDDGFSYYRVAHWEDHQRVDHPARSKVSREGSRKVAIPNAIRRGVGEKYGCTPGESKDSVCYYCGHQGKVHWFKLADGRPSNWVVFPELELDHLECEQDGGETTIENIVLACRPCNRGKGTKHWFDFFISSQSLAIPREDSRKLPLERKGKERKGERGSLRSRRVPADFQPDLEYARSKLSDLDADREVQKFRDWEFKTPRSDWPAVWRNWIDTCLESGRYARVKPQGAGTEMMFAGKPVKWQ